MALHKLFAAAGLALPFALHASESLNPDISLILGGLYAAYRNDPAGYALPGFQLAPEAGPAPEGLSLAESELMVSSAIDDQLFGKATLAFSDAGVELEESYIETLALGQGATLRAGRFFSALGYLNEKHPHTWDFVDAPLLYRALFGKQLGDDGVRLSWLAPTDLFLQLGIEAGRGERFPAGGAANSGTGTRTLFVKTGGDIGSSHSWQLGLAQWRADVSDRQDGAYIDTGVGSSFSGTSRINALDFVWKWAPEGNSSHRSFKLQGEVMRRVESGEVSYSDGTTTSSSGGYQSTARGSYLQGVYQFMPRWRVGLRHDRLASNNRGDDMGVVTAAGLESSHAPRRNSVMVDYSHSEYSRLRLQYALDRSTPERDRQLTLQYSVSLGAHGAHSY